MKLDLVSPMVGTNCHGLWLDLRVRVLTNVKNKGTQGTRGFIQVRVSMRIKILCPVCVGVLLFIGLTPLLPILL
jgi:hypothetical protein